MALTGKLYNGTNNYLSGNPAMHMWEWLDNRLTGWDKYGIFDLSEADAEKGKKPLDLHRHLNDILAHHGKTDDESKRRYRASMQHLATHPDLQGGYKAAAKKFKGHSLAPADSKGRQGHMKAGLFYGMHANGDIMGKEGHFRDFAHKLLRDHGEGVSADHFNKYANQHLTGKVVDAHRHDAVGGRKAQTGRGGGDEDDGPIEYGKSAERATKDARGAIHRAAKMLGHKSITFGGRGSHGAPGEHPSLGPDGKQHPKAGQTKSKEDRREEFRKAVEDHVKETHGAHWSVSHDDLDRIEHGSFTPEKRGAPKRRASVKGSKVQPDPREVEAEKEYKEKRSKKIRKALGMEKKSAQEKRQAANREAGEGEPKKRFLGGREPKIVGKTTLAFKTSLKKQDDESDHEHLHRLSNTFLGKPFHAKGQTHQKKRGGKTVETGISADETDEQYKARYDAHKAKVDAKIKGEGSPPGYETRDEPSATLGQLRTKVPGGGREAEPKGTGQGFTIREPGKKLKAQRGTQRQVLDFLAKKQAGGELPRHMDEPKYIADLKKKREALQQQGRRRGKKKEIDIPTETGEELEKRKALKHGAIAKELGIPKTGMSTSMAGLQSALRKHLKGRGLTLRLPAAGETGKKKHKQVTRRLPVTPPPRDDDAPKKKTREILSPSEAKRRLGAEAALRRLAKRRAKSKEAELEKSRVKQRPDPLALKKVLARSGTSDARGATEKKPKVPERTALHLGGAGFQGKPAPRVRKKMKRGMWTGEYEKHPNQPSQARTEIQPAGKPGKTVWGTETRKDKGERTLPNIKGASIAQMIAGTKRRAAENEKREKERRSKQEKLGKLSDLSAYKPDTDEQERKRKGEEEGTSGKFSAKTGKEVKEWSLHSRLFGSSKLSESKRSSLWERITA